ncbi:hypothetical protein [Bullifex sp.]|uniref:hypothetical protein n=1 Tax=Bullifex sp. TaxID=2815808 RepID=UPI002A8338D2|nr:hypothetical protein [Bullifex sp.]MDY4066395.1 hypothetical protein [Bullifex sp.]
MRKKRILLVLIIAIIFTLPLFSGNQKLFDAFSPEYKSVVKLCKIAGVVGPSSATPITADELKMAIERIDVSKLDNNHKAMLDSVNQKLKSNDDFSYDFDISVAPQIFYSKDFEKIGYKDFFIPFNEQDALLNLSLKAEYGDTAFFETGYDFMNNGAVGIVSEGIDSYTVPSGIPLSSFGFILDYRNGSITASYQSEHKIKNYVEFPALARGAIGGKWMNVVVGRTRQQMGSSRTANLVVGDNYRFQEAMDFTFFAKPFTYSLNLTHFDSQKESGIVDRTRYSGPKQQIRIMHRFDAVIQNTIRAAVNLGNINYVDNPFDIRYLIPVFMSHNLYNYEEDSVITKNYDEANNIMGFEFEYVPLPRLELHMQITVDQFQTIYETNSTVPNAIGGMIGASYLKSFNDFDADFWTEAVYTSPVLYLNNKNIKVDGAGTTIKEYNYDWALGYWRHDTQGDLEWSGYKGGPGVTALTLGCDFDFYKKDIELKSNLTIKVSNDRSYTDINIEPVNKKYLYLQFDNIVNWNYSKHISLYGGLSAQARWDFMNNTPFRFLPQCAFGFKWSI